MLLGSVDTVSWKITLIREHLNPIDFGNFSKISEKSYQQTATQFTQFEPLHSVTYVQRRLITVLGNFGCVAVASFLGVPSPLQSPIAS
jgi:hypothetical protein